LNFKSTASFETLFKIANSAFIAYSLEKNQPKKNGVCVWLSADEHPVFSHYKKAMSAIFGDVVSFSFLPKILNYVGMTQTGEHQQTLFKYCPDVNKPPFIIALMGAPQKSLVIPFCALSQQEQRALFLNFIFTHLFTLEAGCIYNDSKNLTLVKKGDFGAGKGLFFTNRKIDAALEHEQKDAPVRNIPI